MKPNSVDHQVTINGKAVELPLRFDETLVYRRGHSLVVDDGRGFVFECHIHRDISSIQLSGWYFGHTVGLFGTYDYEPSNDFTLPDGLMTTSAVDFVNSWSLDTSCAANDQQVALELNDNIQTNDECANLFVKNDSPLRIGFEIVDPSPFLQLCSHQMTITGVVQDKVSSRF